MSCFMMSREERNFDSQNIAHSFFREKFQSCTNKKAINSKIFFSLPFINFSSKFPSLFFLPLYASYIIQCFFMPFRISFSYKKIVINAYLIVGRVCVVFVVSSLTNLIIFAWLLIYSFLVRLLSFSFFFFGEDATTSYLDLCRFPPSSLRFFSFLPVAIIRWEEKHFPEKLWF